MKIQTFSIVVGGSQCNLNCPYCVSKMTGKENCDNQNLNIKNFQTSCLFAKNSGVSTVLLTGKGEPTLYPEEVNIYLELLRDYQIPFIELQTNGVKLQKLQKELYKWREKGLNTVSLSCMHYTTKINKIVLGESFVSLEDNIELLHSIGFSVRVSCVMLNGYIDHFNPLISNFIDFCKEYKVEQLTIRPVGLSNNCQDEKVLAWTKKVEMPFDKIRQIEQDLIINGATLLLNLGHGGKVYDYKGQNISVNTCLTESSDPDNIRQLIFFPDGHLRYSWQYPGAIIL